MDWKYGVGAVGALAVGMMAAKGAQYPLVVGLMGLALSFFILLYAQSSAGEEKLRKQVERLQQNQKGD